MSIAPATDIPVLAEATARLLATVDGLKDDRLAEPSLLPGWSRGHVLAHLARNADALVNLLTGARTCVPTPMYASPEAREHGIAAGATRPVAEQAADLRASAARFDAAVAAMPEAAWAVEVPHRLGSFPAHEVVARRIGEVEYHHVDLGLPDAYASADWPRPFVDAELAKLVTRLDGHPDVPDLVLVPSDREGRWETGAARRSDGPDLTVGGSAARLLAWLSGRSDGGDLEVTAFGLHRDAPATVLPKLPPLG
ncbi:maleylpyruvate isomerase family mycothiol-dependent enzyme [Streptacidiphilus rugosus]|uniref:maleylpyruvate isomerase family mycothiol-dependent enzyme n=1 Tax=Streptacidiphilus rugosus TaxID=405783 RepID=UPI00056D8229|nr:maleylpyruvate isomerase family mycothiol-dependent enzyme [Streptacidiphilus rugosus]